MFYKIFFWVVIFYLLIDSLKVDDTDKSLFIRSELGLKTDYKTGNQYLTTFWGGITPRLDKDGNIVNIYKKGENNGFNNNSKQF